MSFSDAPEQPPSGVLNSAEGQKRTLDITTQAQDSYTSHVSENQTGDSGVHSELPSTHYDPDSMSLGFSTHHSHISTGAAPQLERERNEFDDHIRNVGENLSSHLQTG